MEDHAANVPPLFLALQESALGAAMRSSPMLYPLAEILHILGFVALVGSIAALDLRVMGAMRAIAIAPLARLVLPMARGGFLLAIVMGFLLLSADAAHVIGNPAFRFKLICILASLVNIALAHLGPWRSVEHWGGEAPARAKLHALLSLVLWVLAVCAGRLIAYF